MDQLYSIAKPRRQEYNLPTACWDGSIVTYEAPLDRCPIMMMLSLFSHRRRQASSGSLLGVIEITLPQRKASFGLGCIRSSGLDIRHEHHLISIDGSIRCRRIFEKEGRILLDPQPLSRSNALLVYSCLHGGPFHALAGCSSQDLLRSATFLRIATGLIYW